MGKKMKLPFLFKNSAADPRSSPPPSSSSWPWPSCNQPRTLSFRAGCGDMFRTINSAYLAAAETQTPESWFTDSPASASFSTCSTEEEPAGGEMTETMIRGLRSERLFFEPGETNSILGEAKSAAEAGEASGGSETATFGESLAMSVESVDPYADFRHSMEEMVEAHGLKDWDNLEELLRCYLRVNGKHNHDYIVGAFVDLLVALAVNATPTNISSGNVNVNAATTCHRDSPASPLSLYTSSDSSSSSSTITVTASCISSSIHEIEERDCSGV